MQSESRDSCVIIARSEYRGLKAEVLVRNIYRDRLDEVINIWQGKDTFSAQEGPGRTQWRRHERLAPYLNSHESQFTASDRPNQKDGACKGQYNWSK